MIPADAIKSVITPLLKDWRIQYGRWTDAEKGKRYAVVRPVGGGLATLVRRPQFTLLLIGAKDDSQTVPSMAADSIIEAMRKKNGGLVCMRAGEPVYSNTDDGRHTYEFSVSTITN